MRRCDRFLTGIASHLFSLAPIYQGYINVSLYTCIESHRRLFTATFAFSLFWDNRRNQFKRFAYTHLQPKPERRYIHFVRGEILFKLKSVILDQVPSRCNNLNCSYRIPFASSLRSFRDISSVFIYRLARRD